MKPLQELSVLALIALIAIPAVASLQPSVAAQKENKAPAGSEASLFSIETLKGESISLDDYQGKVLVLEFFASWCGHCEDVAGELVQVRDNFSPENLAILSIESDPAVPVENVRNFKSDHGGDWAFAKAPDVANNYGVEAFPTFFIIGPDGYITFSSEGAVPGNILSDIIADILGQQTPPENQTGAADVIIDVKVKPENAGGIVASDLKIKETGEPLFTYRVKAGPGYEFAGWSGEDVPENQENRKTLEIVPIAGSEVTANFTQVGEVPGGPSGPSSGIGSTSVIVSFALGAVVAGCLVALGSYLVWRREETEQEG